MDTSEKIIAIVGITEAIKQYGIPTKFAPTIAIIIGGLIGYAENSTPEGILNGILLGATVTGGYAVTKRAGQGIIVPLTEKTSVDVDVRRVNSSALEHDDDRGV